MAKLNPPLIRALAVADASTRLLVIVKKKLINSYRATLSKDEIEALSRDPDVTHIELPVAHYPC